MLKIRHVEIHGFKSFCDRTEVRLESGITAVVGPNGCGKSNIGDALHWVLGEQSAKTLRGGKMEDVIFAGTESRGPHGMAEVSLHLQSNNGDLVAGDPAAVVTRRLFRTGDSEYLINGRKVRLRDIQALLQDAHIGATTYAVIEQGKVDAILSAKPRERRHLIEDAAGITGYKQKRHLAELKLQATEANLLRIHDVILELRRQIGSLKRQAARARRYSRVRDELRGLEGRILAAQARVRHADLARETSSLAAAQAREAETAATLARCEAELEEARETRRALEAALTATRNELHRAAREIDRDESAIRAESERVRECGELASRLEVEAGQARERRAGVQGDRDARAALIAEIDRELARIESMLEEIAAEESQVRQRADTLAETIESRRTEQVEGAARTAEIANTLGHLDKELQRLSAQSSRLENERAAAEREAAGAAALAEGAAVEGTQATTASAAAREAAEHIRGAHKGIEEKIRGVTDEIVRGRETQARLDERVRSLEDLETRLAGIGSGARWLLTREDGQGSESVKGIVADFLRVGPDAEAAVEGYLGGLLAAVVVPTRRSAAVLISQLEDSRAGRCVFAPELARAGDAAEDAPARPLAAELTSHPAVLGPLTDFATTTNGIQGLVGRRLSRGVLVRDLDAAIDLAGRHADRDFVTPAGEVVSGDGTIEGGRGERAEDGLLARRRLLEATRQDRDASAARIAQQQDVRRQLEHERDEASAELGRREAARQEAERTAALSQERAVNLAAEKARAERRIELLVQEIAAAAAETSETHAQRSAAESERELLRGRLEELLGSIDGQKAELEGLREQAARHAERLAEVRQERAAVRERRQHGGAELERLDREIAGLEETLRESAARRQEAQSRGEDAQKAADEARTRLAENVAAHAALSSSVARDEQGLGDLDARAERLEESAKAGRAELEAAKEQRRGSEMALAFADSELKHLAEKCRTTLDEELDALLERVPHEPDIDLDVLDAECASVRSKLEAMGPVNLLAIEEFRELEERHEFFTKQETDLTSSIESLKDTIRRINRTSRERFLEAFEKIRSNFNDTFRLLFGGGRGDIKLMEDEDPLECGLEIHVQPPGKRLQSLSLLSGGEKALSAIALLFAIFRYQPSPFCLLDEVDAALDESNVRRFTRMLKEFSSGTQFIVITHNKRSMEAADTLYGVTMDEPGISRIVSMNLA